MKLGTRFFAVCGFIAVTLGAFGAHALRNKVTTEDLEIWKTATLYLMIHSLAGLFAADKDRLGAASSFAIGNVIFSGSLFALVLTGERWLGAVTPLGGVSYLVGWGILVWQL